MTKLKYAIHAPSFTPDSAGISGLHFLSHQIKEYGYDSRIITPNMPPLDNEIVIYPDCTRGNPFKAKNVVRYLCMYAGYFGQDKDFPESEYMYYYCPDFILNGRNPDNILSMPIVREDRFPYRPPSERQGSCYLAIKYQDYFGLKPYDLPLDCIRLTKSLDIEKLFSTVKKLITFDASLINIEAMLCGIEVEYRFNEKFEKAFHFGDYFDYNNPRESFQKLKKLYFEKQLPDFIKRTQEHFLLLQ